MGQSAFRDGPLEAVGRRDEPAVELRVLDHDEAALFPALPPTYATPADLEAYTAPNGKVTIPPDAGVILEIAERAVDALAGPWPLYSSGKKFDPASLPLHAREALTRATCAAAEYIVMAGIDELVYPNDIVSLPGVAFSGRRSHASVPAWSRNSRATA